MTVALAFRNLTLGYDRHPVVHHLEAEIAEGSLTAIVGPNGAGKSTLLKGVIGTMEPLEGRISLGGISRDKIAYLPQQSDVDRSFPISVRDLVAMGLWREIGPFGRLRPHHRDRVAVAISSVGLTGFEDRLRAVRDRGARPVRDRRRRPCRGGGNAERASSDDLGRGDAPETESGNGGARRCGRDHADRSSARKTRAARRIRRRRSGGDLRPA